MVYVVTRNVKFIKVMQFKQMFVTAVCVLFLLKLKWPKSKNFHETIHERYGHDTLKTVRRYEKDLSRYNKVALDISFLRKWRPFYIELTNQDAAGGKNVTVLKSSDFSHWIWH